MSRVIASKLAADGFNVVGNSGLADTAVKEIESHGRHGAAFAGMRLKGKSMVFTGGSTSIGKATAPPPRRAVPT